jgi:hypothetical protein
MNDVSDEPNELSFNISQVDPELIRLLTGRQAASQVERALLLRYDKPVPLRTGKRGTRSKAEHAHVVKLARLRRRVARRENRPACLIHCQTYLPRVWIDVGHVPID